jgi:hypothetical protein
MPLRYTITASCATAVLHIADKRVTERRMMRTDVNGEDQIREGLVKGLES